MDDIDWMFQQNGSTGQTNQAPVHFLGTHCYDQVRWYMG